MQFHTHRIEYSILCTKGQRPFFCLRVVCSTRRVRIASRSRLRLKTPIFLPLGTKTTISSYPGRKVSLYTPSAIAAHEGWRSWVRVPRDRTRAERLYDRGMNIILLTVVSVKFGFAHTIRKMISPHCAEVLRNLNL